MTPVLTEQSEDNFLLDLETGASSGPSWVHVFMKYFTNDIEDSKWP